MSKLRIQSQKTPLNGTVAIPGDKSISHRAVMLAAIAEGASTVGNWLPAGDTLATLKIVQALGMYVDVDRRSRQGWHLTIVGQGLHGLQPPAQPLDCGNAGTCMRLLAGILAGQRFPSLLDGSEQLRKRPMQRIIEPLQQLGANIEAENGRSPLHIQPAQLQGTAYRMNVASAQVKSAILLAGLYADGETRIYQPGPARDHTERMLAAMGVETVVEGDWVILRHGQQSTVNGRQLSPLNLTVPGDVSSAAFPLIAAAIIPHSQVTLTNVGQNETRTGLLDMLTAMGAQFSRANEYTTGGEPVADLTVRFDELHSADVDGRTVVRAIDEFPIWAVAATQAAGESTVRDAAELRVKEVDRISMLAGELRKMGVNMTEHADGFTIAGPTWLHGAEVDSHGDHRLGMALAVAGLVAKGYTIVQDADCIADSFPGFVTTMRTLGANMEWVD